MLTPSICLALLSMLDQGSPEVLRPLYKGPLQKKTRQHCKQFTFYKTLRAFQVH